MKKHLKFIYNDVELELVNNFKYLVLMINFNGSFKLAITELNKQALGPCMHSLVNVGNYVFL